MLSLRLNMIDVTLNCLTNLRVGRSHGHLAPNKPCLLLALICEIQSGHITSPLITIDDRLITRYFDLYEAATGQRQSANPHLPLWHLKSDQSYSGPLWIPLLQESIANVASQLGQPKSLKALKGLFTQARLDTALYSALQNKQTAHDACALLVAHYLAKDPHRHRTLNSYLDKAFESGSYQKHPETLAGEVKEERQRQARSVAFRTLVLEAYDFRCAASRLRFITPDYRYLVEAAHLIPFSESKDDRPTNGLSLTPNLHWAMDNHLIAPGPDHRWHVSPTIDDLMLDNNWLKELDCQPLLLPRITRWQPDREALAWRLDHLLR